MANYTLNNDTIAALATPHGPGAIAVIRLSGEKAIAIVEKVFLYKVSKT
jgi:tRNA modification GTPase